jgi:integrase
MAQQGYVFKKDNSWFLRYRDNFSVGGQIVRKQKCIKLADVSDRCRRECDLKDLVTEKLSAVREADKCPQSSGSFVDYVEETWLPFVKRSKKPSTYAGYNSYFLRYIKPRAEKGKYALRDFTVAVVSDLLEDVADMHDVNVDTVGKVRSILSAIFTYAIGKGDFPARSAAENPASHALIPESATEPEATIAATREEVKAILAYLATEGLTLQRAAVALMAYTGCRPGEARGLRWEEWNRTAAQIKVARSVWHAVEGTTKTEQSNRYVVVTDELREILLDLWKSQGSPMGGYILARAKGGRKKPVTFGRVNLENMSKRELVPALTRCAVCKEAESAKHQGHAFERDETLPEWHGWYSLRRFHGTQVRHEAGNSDTSAKALGNSKDVFDKHYLKSTGVLPDVRKAVNTAMRGLIN